MVAPAQSLSAVSVPTGPVLANLGSTGKMLIPAASILETMASDRSMSAESASATESYESTHSKGGAGYSTLSEQFYRIGQNKTRVYARRKSPKTCSTVQWKGCGESTGSIKPADGNIGNNDVCLWQSSVNNDTVDTNSFDMSSPGQKTTDDAIQSAVGLEAPSNSATEIDPDMTNALMADLHVDVGPDTTVELDAAATWMLLTTRTLLSAQTLLLTWMHLFTWM